MSMDPDEKYAESFLRPLAGEPRTPSVVDVDRAIADGERRLRRLRTAGAGAAAAVLVLAVTGGWVLLRTDAPVGPPDRVAIGPSPTSPTGSPSSSAPAVTPPTSCTVHRLDVPAGHPPRSVVTGADPTGRYLLGRSYPGSGPRPLIWDNGRVKAVGISGDDPQLVDVTSTGVAVGFSFVDASSGRTAAWVYRSGRLSRLAGDNTTASGINDREVIVGSVDGRPAVWSSPTSRPTMLSTPDRGWTGAAVGIDEDGTIVGALQGPSDREPDGYLWRPDGTLEKLPVPTLRGKPATTYTPHAIRHGWIVGWSALDERGARYIGAPRWNLRTGEVEPFDAAGSTEAVNRYGWTVGVGPAGAQFLADGTSVDLPDLDRNANRDGTRVLTVSDDGRTLAGQADWGEEEEPVAVRWRCR
ncbi:hypothetical protein [Plantactinospora sonchi]|uniref:WD40 repeat domain-containing protein n=1 Tax=Plantactinospora sonchi TaxID=1544735 RepID=A0ABU7RNP3_9ACTN